MSRGLIRRWTRRSRPFRAWKTFFSSRWISRRRCRKRRSASTRCCNRSRPGRNEMNPTQLNTLLDVTRIARDSAATRLARLEQQAQQAREHLQTLLGYSADYAARLQTAAGDELDPA